VLADLGEIRQARRGAEALSILADAEVDLLLLDWDMRPLTAWRC